MVNIPDDVLAQLRRGITHRQIDTGMLCLREHEHLLEHLDPNQKNAARLVGYFAQWIDIGYGQHSRLKDLLARFSTEIRATLPLAEYVDLRLAEGMLAMNEEAADEALEHFDVVLALGDDLKRQGKIGPGQFLEVALPAKNRRVRRGAGLHYESQRTRFGTGLPQNGCGDAGPRKLVNLPGRKI